MKKYIIGFLIGIIVSSGVVFAVNSINARQIDYTNQSGDTVTVEQALNTIYTDLNKKIILNTFGTPTYSESNGSRLANRSTSANIEPGKYIIIYSSAATGGKNTNSASSDITLPTIENSGCVKLSGRYIISTSTGSSNNGAIYNNITSYMCTFYENTTLTAYTTSTTTTLATYANDVSLQIIPINE